MNPRTLALLFFTLVSTGTVKKVWGMYSPCPTPTILLAAKNNDIFYLEANAGDTHRLPFYRELHCFKSKLPSIKQINLNCYKINRPIDPSREILFDAKKFVWQKLGTRKEKNFCEEKDGFVSIEKLLYTTLCTATIGKTAVDVLKEKVVSFQKNLTALKNNISAIFSYKELDKEHLVIERIKAKQGTGEDLFPYEKLDEKHLVIGRVKAKQGTGYVYYLLKSCVNLSGWLQAHKGKLLEKIDDKKSIWRGPTVKDIIDSDNWETSRAFCSSKREKPTWLPKKPDKTFKHLFEQKKVVPPLCPAPKNHVAAAITEEVIPLNDTKPKPIDKKNVTLEIAITPPIIPTKITTSAPLNNSYFLGTFWRYIGSWYKIPNKQLFAIIGTAGLVGLAIFWGRRGTLIQ